MSTENPGVWGIEIGQCALKALRVEEQESGIVATAFDYVEHPKILSQPDADPDQLTREALDKFLSRNDLKGDQVAIGIPGQSGLARFVKLPPVEEKKIADIVRFEAKQQIPFNLDEVVWDFQKIGSGMVTDGFAMDTEIGLFAIKRDTVFRCLQHFKDVNVEVHIVQMAPLALCNFVAYELLGKTGSAANEEGGGKKESIVALDIGTDNSNLVITDGERIIWQRPIPLGGNHFTRAITKDLKLTFAKAEHLKRNAAKSPDLKKILAALKPVLNDFVGEVQRSLGYFTNTHRDAQIQYMMGLGSAFRLPGLQKFLSEKLSLDVQRLQKLNRLTGDSVIGSPVFSENLLSFGVVYGLAIQGLKQSHLQTNLLPQEIQVERMIRAKKPWALTAAAALLLGTSVMTLGYAMQHRAVASDQVKNAMAQGKTVVDKAAKFSNEFVAAEKKIEDDKTAVRSIIAGQDERLNWIQLNQFLSEVIPLPDGSNLNPSAKQMYFDSNPKAQEAFKRLVQLQQKKKQLGEAKIDDEEGADDLIAVNIESVMCMYSDDLPGYPDRLRAINADFDTMNQKDVKRKPTGKGWIIELQGYTYNRGSRRFVIDTILDNITRIAATKLPPPAAAAAPSDPAAPGGMPPTSVAAATPGTTPAPDPAPAAATPPTPEPAPMDAAASGDAAEGQPEVEDKPDDTKFPIGNRVSHAILYQYSRDPDPQPHSYRILHSGQLQALAAGGGGSAPGGGGEVPGKSGGEAGATGGMAGMGGMGGMGGPGGFGGGTGGGWSPLTSGGSGGVGGGMGGMGGKGFGMGGGAPGAPGGGGGGGLLSGAGGAGAGGATRGGGAPGGMMMAQGGGLGSGKGFGMGGGGMGGMPGMGGRRPGSGLQGPGDNSFSQAEEEKIKKARHVRTEFIIYFIWKEPTPSDKLISSPDDPAATPGG